MIDRIGRGGLRTLSLTWALWGAIALLAPGCGGDGEASDGEKKAQDATDGQGGPSLKARRTLQQALDAAGWAKELDADAALKKLASAASGALQAAGEIEDDDGGRVVWGEYAASELAPREQVSVVFKVCAPAEAGGGCTVGTGAHTATGVQLKDAAGAALSAVSLGRPVLLKEAIKGQSEGHPTVLRTGLDQTAIVDPALVKQHFEAGVWGKRRLLVLNAYGPEVSAAPTATLALAASSDRFDQVVHIAFVRRTDIDRLLPTLSPLDVVVWFGAGVIETYKGGKGPKSVGMTVSRGIFGDAYYHRDFLNDLFDYPPMGGPGLLVLAGANTLYADSAGQAGVFASYLRAFPFRPVVGFDGAMSVEEVDAATAALLSSLFAGDTLATALEASTQAAPAAATCLMEPESRETWRLPRANKDFFSKPAASGKLKLFMSINPPLCADVGGGPCSPQAFVAATKAGKDIDPAKLTAFHATFQCEPTFTGPFFACDQKHEASGADFQVRGVLQGAEKDRQIAIYTTGSASKKVRNAVLVGLGTISSADVGGGTTTLSFSGPAVGGTYTDDKGYCCISKKPALSSNTSEASTLTF